MADGPTGIAAMNAGFDAGGVIGGGRVDMGEDGYGRGICWGGDGGQGRAIIGQGDVLRAQGRQFSAKQVQHAELDLGGGRGQAILSTLAVNRRVAPQSGFKSGVEGGFRQLRPQWLWREFGPKSTLGGQDFCEFGWEDRLRSYGGALDAVRWYGFT